MLQAVPDSLASGGDGDCSDGVLSQCVVQGLEGGEGVEVPRPGCIGMHRAVGGGSPIACEVWWLQWLWRLRL